MKVALIGCGSIAKTHLDVLKHLGHDVIALCDRSEEKAAKLPHSSGAAGTAKAEGTAACH